MRWHSIDVSLAKSGVPLLPRQHDATDPGAGAILFPLTIFYCYLEGINYD
jgi:hypothetical protein